MTKEEIRHPPSIQEFKSTAIEVELTEAIISFVESGAIGADPAVEAGIVSVRSPAPKSLTA